MSKVEFHSEFGFLIQKISLTLRREADRLLRQKHGISRTQFLLLSALHKNSNTYEMQEHLSAHLGITKGAISRQLLIATQAGYISRYPAIKDSRQKKVELTPLGQKLLVQCKITVDLAERSIFTKNPEIDKEQLISNLALLSDALSAYDNNAHTPVD
ncbi:hypothetical protein EON76_06160 [bacterium]|nr:MAG: hypothetical protein EON76_06160 [bacterium]